MPCDDLLFHQELRPHRQAVWWESDSEKVHCSFINYWGRMGLTFRQWDFVERGTKVTYSFVWMKIQGKLGDFCWHFLHSVLILSCWFSSGAPLAPCQVIPLQSVWDVQDKRSQGITSMTFLSNCSGVRVFWPRKLAFCLKFSYWKKRKHQRWKVEPDVYKGPESSCN